MHAWKAFLSNLEIKLGKEVVEKWLRPLKILSFDACNIYLEGENSFQIDWFEEHIRKIAQKHLINNNDRKITVHLKVKDQDSAKPKKLEKYKIENFVIDSDFIDDSMTFSNFIFDQPNALTVKFFKHLTFGTYNPIFLYGPSGTGKTHLLCAIGNKLRLQNHKVFYVHAQTFTEHVVKAIRGSQMGKFREIYRNQEILIIDDVQDFARLIATQEELFHTFNTLHTSGKQIILSSNVPPNKLKDIEPRLISRFEWGILLELLPLTPPQMEQVLKNKAHLHQFTLSHSITHFIAQNFSGSPQSMMRALEALMLRHKSKDTLSLEGAEHLLKDLLEEENIAKITPEKILLSTSAYFGIRKEDILGKSQAKECVFPRKLAMFLCRRKLELPYLAIARFFGRDHSTVMGSIKYIENNLTSSDEISTALDEIENLLQKKN